MIDEKTEQRIRLCGAPGCDNPIGIDGRRRFCSQRCSKRIYNEKTREWRRLKKAGRVCASGGCNHPVEGRRSRYCSKECALKAYRKQTREGAERSRKKRQGASKPKKKQERHEREYRPLRLMQHVPVEKWSEYRFLKKGVTQ